MARHLLILPVQRTAPGVTACAFRRLHTMTNLVSPFEFGRLTGRGAPIPTGGLHAYYGHSFRCACGAVHVLDANVAVSLEMLGKNKFVAECPANLGWMNFLKVKGIFRVAGLEAICSTKIDSEQQHEEFFNGIIEPQIGALREIVHWAINSYKTLRVTNPDHSLASDKDIFRHMVNNRMSGQSDSGHRDYIEGFLEGTSSTGLHHLLIGILSTQSGFTYPLSLPSLARKIVTEELAKSGLPQSVIDGPSRFDRQCLRAL